MLEGRLVFFRDGKTLKQDYEGCIVMCMIQFADEITERELAILNSKSGGLVAATNCTSLIWTVDEPQPGRRWFRLRHCSDREHVFADIAEPDLERISEYELKARIIQRDISS